MAPNITTDLMMARSLKLVCNKEIAVSLYMTLTDAVNDAFDILERASSHVGAIVVRTSDGYMPVIGMPYILGDNKVSEYASLEFLQSAAESHGHDVVAILATIR